MREQDRHQGIWKVFDLDRISSHLVCKVDCVASAQGAIETDGEVDCGLVLDLFFHADNVGYVLRDRLGLVLGVTGVEDDTLDGIGKEAEQVGQGGALNRKGE